MIRGRRGNVSLPIDKHPGNLSPEMGRLPGCLSFLLPVSLGQWTGPGGDFFLPEINVSLHPEKVCSPHNT
ncbi:hypothetical protein D3C74_393400 [compost metagenome]